MPDSNSFTRSDALGYDLFAASRLNQFIHTFSALGYPLSPLRG